MADRTFLPVLPAWYNQVSGNVLSGGVPGKAQGSAIYLANHSGQPGAVRNFGNRVCNNRITDQERLKERWGQVFKI